MARFTALFIEHNLNITFNFQWTRINWKHTKLCRIQRQISKKIGWDQRT